MALINWFRQVLGIMYLESRWIKRQPLWIVQGFLSSFGFIIVFFAWGSFRALENLIVAFIIVGAWSQGLNIVAQMIGWNKILYEQDRLIASPVTLSAYFFGIVLANTPFMLVNLIPSIILAILLGVDITSFLMLLLLIPIALILGAFLSLIIILRIKKSNKHIGYNQSIKNSNYNNTPSILSSRDPSSYDKRNSIVNSFSIASSYRKVDPIEGNCH